jgi:hypothetical protein
MSQPIKIRFKPSPTGKKFHKAKEFVRAMMGPRGSGKSTHMSWELMYRGCSQKPGPDGIRRTRFAVIRNTYPELRDTTLKTWLTWFPEEYFGKFNRHDMVHNISFRDVNMEVIFRALDRPEDIKKLLSLELTGAWINEAREVVKGVIDGLIDAIGRYPRMQDGGPTWKGLLLDTNPCDTNNWWYKTFEQKKPDGWVLFKQPGGLMEVDGKFVINPEAENIANLDGGYGYYLKGAAGASLDHIRVYYCGYYGFVKEGRAVYPEFYDHVHILPEPYLPHPALPVFVGLDFGLTPAAVFAQRQANGQWVWFKEIVTQDIGVERFAQIHLKTVLNQYSGFKIYVYGDPAGSVRTQTDEKTCYQILESEGISAEPAPGGNTLTLRREAVASALSRLIDGKPGLMISPECEMLRGAFQGGYHFRRVQVSGDERFQEQPEKNMYSHVSEAGQYLMLGAGEGDALLAYEEPKLLKNYNRMVSQYGENAWML